MSVEAPNISLGTEAQTNNQETPVLTQEGRLKTEVTPQFLLVPYPLIESIGHTSVGQRVLNEILHTPSSDTQVYKEDLQSDNWQNIVTKLPEEDQFQLNLEKAKKSEKTISLGLNYLKRRLLRVEDSKNPSFVEAVHTHKANIEHEGSHSVVVKKLGGSVLKRVVGLSGNVKGFVSFAFNSVNRAEYFRKVGVAASASMAAKDIFGEISGFGGDSPQALRCAAIYNFLKTGKIGDYHATAAGFRSEARSLLSAKDIEEEGIDIARENLG